MPVDIYLQDERGNEIDKLVDLRNPIYNIINTYKIGRYEKGDFCLFNGIDLYGNTYFNEIQMERLKVECEGLKKIIKEEDIIEFLNKLIALIDKGLVNGPNYIKFVGD